MHVYSRNVLYNNRHSCDSVYIAMYFKYRSQPVTSFQPIIEKTLQKVTVFVVTVMVNECIIISISDMSAAFKYTFKK